MWFGIISATKAEYFMHAPALAGGFVAIDIPLIVDSEVQS